MKLAHSHTPVAVPIAALSQARSQTRTLDGQPLADLQVHGLQELRLHDAKGPALHDITIMAADR